MKVTQKDLFDCQKEDFVGYDQMIFLAGLSNDPMAEFNPSLNFRSNGALPSYLAYVAKLVGVKRYIYGSSCSVYGYTVNELYNEESPVTCNYPYGISKLQGERGVLQLQDENFSVIALRQGTVSGYSPRMRFDLNRQHDVQERDARRKGHRQQRLDLAAPSRYPRRDPRLSPGRPGPPEHQRRLQPNLRQLHRRRCRRHGQGRG